MGIALKYQNKGRQCGQRKYGKATEGLCSKCDKVKLLHKHHIDEDTHNNAESNILRICNSCHQKLKHKFSRKGRRSRLTISDLAKIRERHPEDDSYPRYPAKDLGVEFGYSANYIRGIRRGDRDTVPVESQPERVEVPADYVPHNKVGKPRALSSEQLSEIQGALPMGGGTDLGRRRALLFADKFGVHITTIYKARSGAGCYGEG